MTRATADRLGPKVCFQTGKPPCFLGSWTSFAFTHHLIVCGGVSRTVGLKHMQFGALTLSSPVRKQHYSIRPSWLSFLQVVISKEKSLISRSGCFEFAKRFLIRRGELCIFPFSILCLDDCRLCEFYCCGSRVCSKKIVLGFFLVSFIDSAVLVIEFMAPPTIQKVKDGVGILKFSPNSKQWCFPPFPLVFRL